MREILYAQFIEASQYAEDPYWKVVFENLAYGLCPFGVYISKGFLCCSIKTKDFVYKIDKKDSLILYTETFNLLRNKAQITSSSDKTELYKHFQTLEQELRDNKRISWSSIKKKSIKDNLIESFVLNMKTIYGLSPEKTRSLHSLIQLGLLFKTITNNDIIYEEGQIISIEGFEFDICEFIVTRDLITDTNEKKESPQHKPTFSAMIRKCSKDEYIEPDLSADTE